MKRLVVLLVIATAACGSTAKHPPVPLDAPHTTVSVPAHFHPGPSPTGLPFPTTTTIRR